MLDLYSVKETAKIFGLSPSQLRYWTQTGFVSPTVRRGGRLFYTFRDLVGVKAAKDLLDSGMTIERARPGIESLRRSLPENLCARTPLTICFDGRTLEVTRDDDARPATREVVVAFRVSTLAERVESAVGRPIANELFAADGDARPALSGQPRAYALRTPMQPDRDAGDGIPAPVEPHATERTRAPSAYECFRDGFAAEERGALSAAASLYQRALDLEPTLASAHTNLGNVLYRQGRLEAARTAYERALEHDPDQPEARYNLGNLLDELGETELAIAELRQVVSRHPDFADAHYNLGLVLMRIGGEAQARAHLTRYLELDRDSEWAARAQGYLTLPVRDAGATA